MYAHHSLTWIVLVLERLHPLLLAQRPLRPGLSPLVPHRSHPYNMQAQRDLHIVCIGATSSANSVMGAAVRALQHQIWVSSDVAKTSRVSFH